MSLRNKTEISRLLVWRFRICVLISGFCQITQKSPLLFHKLLTEFEFHSLPLVNSFTVHSISMKLWRVVVRKPGKISDEWCVWELMGEVPGAGVESNDSPILVQNRGVFILHGYNRNIVYPNIVLMKVR